MSDAQLRIRPFQVTDLPGLVRLDAAAGGQSRLGFFEKRLLAQTRNPDGFVSLVAVGADGEPQGYCLAQVLDGEFGATRRVAVLDGVGVGPGWQGQGVGRALMQAFDAEARQRGVAEVRTQADWQQPQLLEFFAAAGFELAPRVVLERDTQAVGF